MIGLNSPVLGGADHGIRGFSSGLTTLVSSVLRAVCDTGKINLTTIRINVLGEIIIVSVNRNPVRLIGPRVAVGRNRRRRDRNYLSLPNGCNMADEPRGIRIGTRSEGNG